MIGGYSLSLGRRVGFFVNWYSVGLQVEMKNDIGGMKSYRRTFCQVVAMVSGVVGGGLRFVRARTRYA